MHTTLRGLFQGSVALLKPARGPSLTSCCDRRKESLMNLETFHPVALLLSSFYFTCQQLSVLERETWETSPIKLWEKKLRSGEGSSFPWCHSSATMWEKCAEHCHPWSPAWWPADFSHLILIGTWIPTWLCQTTTYVSKLPNIPKPRFFFFFLIIS